MASSHTVYGLQGSDSVGSSINSQGSKRFSRWLLSLQTAELDAYDLRYVVMCHALLYHARGIISVIHINRPRGGSTVRGPHALVHKKVACAGCTYILF